MNSADAMARRAEMRRTALDAPFPISDLNPKTTEYVVHSGTIYALGGESSSTVYVDGRALAPGHQSQRAVALLGIDEAALDARWRQIVHEENEQYSSAVPSSLHAFRHQEQMGWRVEVTLDAVPGVDPDIDDLAFVDARAATRWAVYAVRRWVPGKFGTGDPPIGTRDEQVIRTERLPQSAAFSGIFSGVSEEEVRATQNARTSLQAARDELTAAAKEMEIAIRVAKTSWQGDRAAKTIGKLADDQQMIDHLRDAVDGWWQTVHELASDQRKACDADEQLKREIAWQTGVTIVAGVLTYGAGAAVAGTVFAGRLAWLARTVHGIRVGMQARIAARSERLAKMVDRLDDLRRTRAGVHAAELGGRIAGEVTSNAVVNVGTGKPLTEDMATNMFLAFTGFELGTWVAKGLNGLRVTNQFANTVGTAAIAGSAQTEIAERIKNEDQTGGFLAGFPTGLAEVLTVPGLKRGLAENIRKNDDLHYLARMKAYERASTRPHADPAARRAEIDRLAAEEIDAMAERMAGPIMQFTFGAAAAPAGDLVGQPFKPNEGPPTVTTPASATS